MIKRGSSGQAVRRVQMMMGIKPTGRFDPRFEAQVKAHQRKLGLKADGVIGPVSWPRFVEDAVKEGRGGEIWPRASIACLPWPVGAENP